ncbi:MAG: D-alanyl-D-alanine carboxypeptidase/D-alanyl-D-alanine-endopeptidase [Pseudonocardiales bacterium]|nr:MAG: D-alanyl-D-alanine carboxypeptidase/D-alanyl-D-alanine-endopeptidase [Pseudonocardiales bacterium]
MTGRSNRGRRTMVLAAVIALAVLGVGSYFFVRLGDQAERGASPASPSAHASTSHPTTAPISPAPTPPPTVLAPGAGSGPLPTSKGVLRALGARLADPRLGTGVSADVADLATGTGLLDDHATRLGQPASTAKIVTAVAALQALPADFRFVTTVLAGATPGQVVLVGGGDPTLSAAKRGAAPAYDGAPRISALAASTLAAGATQVSQVVVDGSRFTGPAIGPGWDGDDVGGGDVAPVSALTVDGGRVNPRSRVRTGEPDLAAGRAFAAALGVPGATVTRGTAPAGAKVLATVSSAPVGQLVAQMLSTSDNVLAEYLIRQVAIRTGRPASFTGGAAAVRAVVSALGVPPAEVSMADGSGLSRADRLAPAALVATLRAAAAPGHGRLHALIGDLPVGGYSGTLAGRYRSGSAAHAAGQVRAKTGTLTGVSTLAGVVTDDDGRVLAFAFLADEVATSGTTGAESALDEAAAALAGCGCR